MTSVLDTARSIAAAHPDAMLPCPVCAASLRAENLDKHLGKVHADETPSSSWRGPERAIMGVLIGPPTTMALMIAIIATQTRMSSSTFVVLAFGFLGAFAPLALAFLGVFKGRVEITGDEIRLHYAFELLTRTVKLGKPIEVGGLRTTKPNPVLSSYQDDMPDGGWGSVDVSAGIYVRFDDGTSAITIRSRKGTGLRKHWDPAGWRSGKKRRHWHIQLQRPEIVALEYELSARELLAPRPS